MEIKQRSCKPNCHSNCQQGINPCQPEAEANFGLLPPVSTASTRLDGTKCPEAEDRCENEGWVGYDCASRLPDAE